MIVHWIATAAVVAMLQGGRPTTYRIRIDTTLSSAHVSVSLPTGTTRLYMDSVQAEHLARGWATFVRDLRVHGTSQDIDVTTLLGARWRLGEHRGEPLTLEYRVDLAFARGRWPAGNEQAAAVFPDALYAVGRALFVTSDAQSASVVEFVLPAGWRVSTPWRPVDSSGRRFRADTPAALVRNPLVIGRHASLRLERGPFDLELALPGHSPNVASIAEPALRRVLDGYLALFPTTPPSRYLMTFFPSTADDGEGFLDGAAFTTADSVTADGMILWGNFLAHELMHFWNGQRIRGAGPRASWRWFAEGFTEYYANVMLARQGVISRELFRKKAERHLANYLYFATSPALPRMSLAEAGSNTSANRFGVYDGGWTVALCVDGLIRDVTGEARSLDDVMRAVWDRFGAGSAGYTAAALDSVANDVAGRDLGGIFRRYTHANTVLPVSECVGRFGLSVVTKGYAAEAYLFSARGAMADLQRRLP